MKQLVFCNTDLCTGCNRCVRNCPVETANIVTLDDDGNIRVDIDADSCIACGACIDVCRHEARYYKDDLEIFLEAVRRGVRISVMIAPAIRSNHDDLGRLIAWFRKLGADKVHDVSLGADLCIWGHIRYLQKNPGKPIITQPCPAIVNCILKYHPNLLQYLSPVHSPMACSAVYMKKYEKIDTPIAAISPCIAKTHEFERTGLIKYNVTFERLFKYLEEHKITLPEQTSGFDHYECGLGSIFSMPGGLKENIEFFLGKSMRIDRSEGPSIVYHALNDYESQRGKNLPVVFDVLNCLEGCNVGSGAGHNKNIFEVNHAMDQARKAAAENRDMSYFDSLYQKYDDMFRLEDFLCGYTPTPIHTANITDSDIERAFLAMDKKTDLQRKFDCSACGSSTCLKMARKIALRVNIPENCQLRNRERADAEHRVAIEEHQILADLHKVNIDNANKIEEEMDRIKEFVTKVYADIGTVSSSIAGFGTLERTIDDIAATINIIAIDASIEAARVGASGKAFGVIAAEVQSLAKASQDSIEQNHIVFSAAKASVGDIESMMKQILDIVTTAYNNIQDINRANEEKSNTISE
jgi:ferredoxin